MTETIALLGLNVAVAGLVLGFAGWGTIGWGSRFRQLYFHLRSEGWEQAESFFPREGNEEVAQLILVQLKLLRVFQVALFVAFLVYLAASVAIMFGGQMARIATTLTLGQVPELPAALFVLTGALVSLVLLLLLVRAYIPRLRAIENRLKVLDTGKDTRGGRGDTAQSEDGLQVAGQRPDRGVQHRIWIDKCETFLRRERDRRGVFWSVIGTILALVIALVALF